MNYRKTFCCVAALLMLGAMKADTCSAQRYVVYSPVRAPLFAPLRPVLMAPAIAPRMVMPVPRAIAYRMARPVTSYRTTYYAPAAVVYRPRVFGPRVYYW